MSDHDDGHGGGGIPHFVKVGVGILVLILVARYVGIPAISESLCATIGTGCSVSEKLSSGPAFTVHARSAAGPNRSANVTEHFQHHGCPAGVRIGQRFACLEANTGVCECR